MRTPKIADAAISAAPKTIVGANSGCRGDVSMNRDAITPAAKINARVLPSMATIALAVTATGVRMRIIISLLAVRRTDGAPLLFSQFRRVDVPGALLGRRAIHHRSAHSIGPDEMLVASIA